MLNPQTFDEPAMTPLERKQSRQAERSLLRDNHMLPPKHAHHSNSAWSRIYRRLFSTKLPQQQDEERPAIVVQAPSETSPLLSSSSTATSDSLADGLDETWGHAVAEHKIRTTWRRETKTIASYSAPLIVTFLLQYSINVTSIFAVGRIGRIELGAVSCKSPVARVR